jgi:uncharacterized membrane protein YhaH (DUF805 family)
VSGPARPLGLREAVETCIRKYAVFRGRASRSEFWYWNLAVAVVLFVLSLLAVTVTAAAGVGAASALMDSLLALTFLFVILPSLSVTVRRLHDVGMNGWFVLLALVPFYGLAPYAIFGILSPQDRPNEYG